MKKTIIASSIFTLATVLMMPLQAVGFDEAAAKALAKKNDCFKCHAIDKTKKGPAYKDIAFKFKDKPDAEEKMIKNITTGNKVILEDCTEEEHKEIDTKDPAALKNLVAWIRSVPGGVERGSAKDKCKK